MNHKDVLALFLAAVHFAVCYASKNPFAAISPAKKSFTDLPDLLSDKVSKKKKSSLLSTKLSSTASFLEKSSSKKSKKAFDSDDAVVTEEEEEKPSKKPSSSEKKASSKSKKGSTKEDSKKKATVVIEEEEEEESPPSKPSFSMSSFFDSIIVQIVLYSVLGGLGVFIIAFFAISYILNWFAERNNKLKYLESLRPAYTSEGDRRDALLAAINV